MGSLRALVSSCAGKGRDKQEETRPNTLKDKSLQFEINRFCVYRFPGTEALQKLMLPSEAKLLDKDTVTILRKAGSLGSYQLPSQTSAQLQMVNPGCH